MAKRLSNDKIEGVFTLVDEKFKDIIERLDRIEGQTTRTNGRVSSLEDWKSTSKGAITVLSTIVIPIILYLVYLHIPR